MRELGKIVIISAIVSCCVVIGGNFGRNICTYKFLERRIAHLEKCKDAHRDLIEWMLQNYLDDRLSGYKITPETSEVIDGERCEPCRNGWVTFGCECKCKHKTIETGRYFLKKKSEVKLSQWGLFPDVGNAEDE